MDIYSADFIITILLNLVLTILGYCTVPIILRLKNGKYEYKKGHKIILINCAIVWLIFAIIKIEQGLDATGGAVILYYFIDKAILLKSKEDEEEIKKEDYSLSFKDEKVEKDSRLTYAEDVKLLKIHEQSKEKYLDTLKENLNQDHIREKIIYKSNWKGIIAIICAFLFLIIILVAIDVIKTNDYEEQLEFNNKIISQKNEKISEYESQITSGTSNILNNEEKAKFLDENIVFVLEGYGNYYYTYDQVKQVTQGKEYTYWAYNKEAAITKGYKKWQ